MVAFAREWARITSARARARTNDGFGERIARAAARRAAHAQARLRPNVRRALLLKTHEARSLFWLGTARGGRGAGRTDARSAASDARCTRDTGEDPRRAHLGHVDEDGRWVERAGGERVVALGEEAARQHARALLHRVVDERLANAPPPTIARTSVFPHRVPPPFMLPTMAPTAGRRETRHATATCRGCSHEQT